MIRQEEHHGTRVWTETLMDELRKEKCLCLQCHFLGDCDIAKELYEICKSKDLALAITRCKMFDKGDKTESLIDNANNND